MILLEANQCLLFDGIPLTDWLQAIGAIIAIIAVIYGWSQLRKDSKEKQTQIDTLTALAKETALQTQEMIEGNRLQIEHLKKYEEHIEIIKSSNQREAEKRESEIQLRISEVKPKFNLEETKKYLDGKYFELSSNMTFVVEGFKFTFKNLGEKAKIIDVEEMGLNSFIININPNFGEEIEKMKTFTIVLKPDSSTFSMEDCNLKFKLTYEDILGNVYFQIITGTYKKNNFTISYPKLQIEQS